MERSHSLFIAIGLFLLPLPAAAQDVFVRPRAATALGWMFAVGAVVAGVISLRFILRHRSGQDADEGVLAPLKRNIGWAWGALALLAVAAWIAFGWRVTRIPELSSPEPLARPFLEVGGSDVLDRVYPKPGSTEVSRNTSVYLWFNEPIDRTTLINDHQTETLSDDIINAANVKIWDDQGMPEVGPFLRTVRARSNADSTVVAFDPGELLGESARDRTITIELAGVKTIVGKSIFGSAGSFRWSFVVGRALDREAPTLLHAFPMSGVKRYPPNGGIQLEWSEPVDPLSFATGMAVTQQGGRTAEVVAGRWHVASGERLTEFFPQSVCSVNACRQETSCWSVNATILAKSLAVDVGLFPRVGVRDFSGNLFEGSPRDIVSFSVGTSLHQGSPTIIAVDPLPNMSAVHPAAPVKAVFSEILRASTIDRATVQLKGDGKWRSHVSTDFSKEQSSVTIAHEPLLPSSVVSALISSEVQDIYQNCFLECKGP